MRQTGPPADSCPYSPSAYFDDVAGAYWPTSCKRVTCPFCGPRIAYKLAGAVALALGPGSGAGLLTLRAPQEALPRDAAGIWRTFAPLIHSFLGEIDDSGVDFRAAYVVERSQAGRAHVHLVHWGDRLVRASEFAAAGRAVGLGYADSQPVRTRVGLARYILKAPLHTFDLAPAPAEALLLDFKALNGARLIHTSGASGPFWRDGWGNPIRGGVRKARARAWDQLRLHGLVRADVGEEGRLVRQERTEQEAREPFLFGLIDP